jgi:thiol:disulfide interchange protein
VIKILSFVKQAGESRGRIFALNLAYAAGVIGVFLALATLAVTLQKGWGELFQNSEFNLIMACLVFAMGLSLLGVFEIPVPGMVGSAAGAQTQQGLLGAFLTGILATLLATPCSGPFMGAALAWSVRETAGITFLIWGVMGIGMASPYLVFGAFPQALRWLPKPGAWMERFKEFSGFVLMGSVIFIITFLDQRYTIPLLIMLLGISVGLWMIGNLYDVNSHIRHKTLVRFTAVTLTVLICGVGFWLSRPASIEGGKLPWEPFTEARLNELRQQNKTVLIDFTADWCLSCKTNELVALNTPETLELVNKHDVVTLVADYTDPSDEIKIWLNKFDSVSVPLTVIFPGSRPNEPILIRDLFSQAMLLQQLEKAVAEPVVNSAAHRCLIDHALTSNRPLRI